jgi:hypothetical protein
VEEIDWAFWEGLITRNMYDSFLFYIPCAFIGVEQAKFEEIFMKNYRICDYYKGDYTPCLCGKKT